MKSILKSIFVFTFFFYSSIFSQESDTTESNTELWYLYFGLGYSKTFYPSELQEIVDFLKEQEDVTNTPLSIDFLGVYIHLATKTIGGLIISGAADRYEDSDGNKIQINQSTTSVSIIHFIGRDFGSGVFIRADMGMAQLSGDIFKEKEYGFGLLAGGGWSFDFGGTRLLLNANYAYRGVES